MGLRIRKSINLGGGFRVNISKSGIGYSWGFKGYRITKTASGKTRRTVSIPGTGISYVTESGKSNAKSSNAQKSNEKQYENYHDIQKVESANIETLSSDVYKKLFSNITRVKVIVWGLVILSIIFIIVPPIFCLLLIAAFAASRILRLSIEYEFDEFETRKWEELSKAWENVSLSKDLQQITLTAKSNNIRHSAGIENTIESEKMSVDHKLPWYIRTNVTPVVFKMKKVKMAILPDRLLIFDKKIGAIEYSDVKFNLSSFAYLNGSNIPDDSEIIKYVWKVANKDGSRDKRVKDNKQIPLMKYGQIIITSTTGLNIQFICSNEHAVDNLNEVLKKYSMI